MHCVENVPEEKKGFFSIGAIFFSLILKPSKSDTIWLFLLSLRITNYKACHGTTHGKPLFLFKSCCCTSHTWPLSLIPNEQPATSGVLGTGKALRTKRKADQPSTTHVLSHSRVKQIWGHEKPLCLMYRASHITVTVCCSYTKLMIRTPNISEIFFLKNHFQTNRIIILLLRQYYAEERGSEWHSIFLSVWTNWSTNAVCGSKHRQIGGETELFVF